MLTLYKIFFVEILIFFALFGGIYFIHLYKLYFPKHSTDLEVSKKFNPEEEEVYDTGYLDDINSFEQRIQEMSSDLEVDKLNYATNPTEIITDEYERRLEGM